MTANAKRQSSDPFLEVVSWEYVALREEIRQCYQNLFQVLTWGTTLLVTAVGVIAHYFPEVILWLLIVPPVLFTLYVGELQRISRAARFLRFVEEKVNRYLDASELVNDTSWRRICDATQESIKEIEKNLLVGEYGYDFRKPLFWEVVSTLLCKLR